MRPAPLAILPVLLICNLAHAGDETVLRMASITPDGTSWSREIKAWSRDVEADTHGAVRIRWYLAAIAGDEHTALGRVRRGQLDGAAGALQCQELAPSLSVLRVIGLIQSRAEALYLINQLRPTVDEEMRKNGFVLLAINGFGNDVMFLRQPLRTLAEIRKTPTWAWNADPIQVQQMGGMGFQTVLADVSEVARLYDDKRIDALFAVPTAALAFQWTSRARYFMDLRSSYLPGCIVVTQHSFDQLTYPQQQAVRAASAKLATRFGQVAERDDDALLNGLFERQGMVRLKPSEALRDEFFQAALEARQRIDPRVMPPDTLTRALSILSDYRAEHP